MPKYSPAVLDHFGRPRNAGSLDRPDATGTRGVPGRGNFVVVQLRVRDALIVDVRFQTFGCPSAIACGSVVTEMVKGKSLAEARAVSSQSVLAALGGLPPGKTHCAALAAGALHDALESCQSLGGDLQGE